jgi:hypothetical protein
VVVRFFGTFCFFACRFTDASTSDNNFQTRFTIFKLLPARLSAKIKVSSVANTGAFQVFHIYHPSPQPTGPDGADTVAFFLTSHF